MSSKGFGTTRKIQKWRKKQVCGEITENEEPEELTFQSWDGETECVLQAHPDSKIWWIYLNHRESRKWIIRSFYCGNEPNCEVLNLHSTNFRMGFCLKVSIFPFRYQKIFSDSDTVDLLSSSDQLTGCLNSVDTLLLVLHIPWSILGSACAWWQQSRSPGAEKLQQLDVCISGFSACICVGEAGSGCWRCYRKCPASDTPGLCTQPRKHNGWECQGRSKAVPLLVLQKGDDILGQKLKASSPARLLCHLKYVLPLQTDEQAANHHPDFTCLPWRANFLPCSLSWHTNCCTSVANHVHCTG